MEQRQQPLSLPLISVLMPVRNEAPYLQTALDSLYRQTLTNWELIAVDDGSTDQTPDILATAAAGDSRVKVIQRSGGGLVAALNAGLSDCRAPLVARFDGDDVSHPRRLALQADYLARHPTVGLVACNFRHFPRTGLKQGMIAYESWQNGLIDHELICRDLFVESPFVHPGVMIRRSLLEQLGGYLDAGWPEDYDLWLRMAAIGVRFARIPQPLLFWRDHPERATRTMAEYAGEAFRACKLHHLRLGYLHNCSEIVMAGAGQEARAWQRLLATAGIFVSAWLDVDPRKRGRILHNAPIYTPHEVPLAGRKMLVAIGVPGANQQFRQLAEHRKWQEGMDFVIVA